MPSLRLPLTRRRARTAEATDPSTGRPPEPQGLGGLRVSGEVACVLNTSHVLSRTIISIPVHNTPRATQRERSFMDLPLIGAAGLPAALFFGPRPERKHRP